MNTKPKVIAFDIFGTVVDWHGSIAAEVLRLKLPVDANAFATAWPRRLSTSHGAG
jgi:2-haloacid dehalogenase